MLLNVLVNLKLLEKHDGIYTNTPVAARFLMEGTPDSARTAQLHMANMWRRWSKLTEAVHTGTAVDSGRDNGWVKSFIAAMDHTARGRARAVAQAVELNGEKRMLDLGGGSGAYSIAFVKASSALHCEIVDLPEVLPITQEHIRQAGLSDRISTRPGDMLTVSLAPASYDLILLSAICHMFSPEENRQLLNRAYAALAPQGRLVISDFILDADKTSPRFGTLFALNMLVGTRAGASYSEPEYDEWMKAAGFASSKRVRMPGPVNLMIATK
jgi:ubiquinone/menaquinone biosynthesis C-methylase UbiE